MSRERDFVVLGGSGHPSLGAAIARELGSALGDCAVERFPDGEVHVEVDARRIEDRDVFVVQPTCDVVGDRILELLLVADACRRAGAARMFAIVPYFGFARQDRRKKPGEALGARVVADVLGTARFERIVTLDLHSDVVEASLGAPVEHLTAIGPIAEAIASEVERDAVVVAPDLGALRRAREYARLLRLPVAAVHKVRRSGTHVDVERIAGDVRGLRPILVDDMVATGGTIAAAANALHAEGAKREIIVAATHAVLTPGSMERMREAGLKRLFVTDTLALRPADAAMRVISVAPMLAACVRRLAGSTRS